MRFDGAVLNRGYWLYVWDIIGPESRHLYVGRTGDSSSQYASSPFARIGRHLDPRPNAKGNAITKQILSVPMDPSHCTFEMLAIGPIFPEQETFAAHIPHRDLVGAMETALAARLRARGYSVLGSHGRSAPTDPELFRRVTELVDAKFPMVTGAALLTCEPL